MAIQDFINWKNNPTLDQDLRTELEAFDETDIQNAFFTDIAFGTGGMRGILGPGTNRMNVYTLSKAAYGFGAYLKDHFDDVSGGVVIAYDNRHNNTLFAEVTASVLATFGIKSYIFDDLAATPLLSFAVRDLKAIGGVVITASHNPPEYSGFKIYDELGCQLVPSLVKHVITHIESIKDIFSIERATNVEDFKLSVPKEVTERYIENVLSVQKNKELTKQIKIVFTPQHGTSRLIGPDILRRAGYEVFTVDEQMSPDPNFSNTASPNPENKEAFEAAIELGKEVGADVLIATDPDADRLGIAVKSADGYELLTGNQTGAMFIQYVCEMLERDKSAPEHGVVYNTIVTGPLGGVIARSYGYEVVSTLTGFKFIGEQAALIESTDKSFVFGYEESYGYVFKDFVRDKDALQAVIGIADLINYLIHQNTTALDYLDQIYENYGFYLEDLVNIYLEGQKGALQIQTIMNAFRNDLNMVKEAFDLVRFEDYQASVRISENKKEVINLPKSNVLKYILNDDTWFVLRPSGTEPKLKIYIGVKGHSKQDAVNRIASLKDEINRLIDTVGSE